MPGNCFLVGNRYPSCKGWPKIWAKDFFTLESRGSSRPPAAVTWLWRQNEWFPCPPFRLSCFPAPLALSTFTFVAGMDLNFWNSLSHFRWYLFPFSDFSSSLFPLNSWFPKIIWWWFFVSAFLINLQFLHSFSFASGQTRQACWPRTRPFPASRACTPPQGNSPAAVPRPRWRRQRQGGSRGSYRRRRRRRRCCCFCVLFYSVFFGPTI